MSMATGSGEAINVTELTIPLEDEIRFAVSQLHEETGVTPCLAILGDQYLNTLEPVTANDLYAAALQKTAHSLGIATATDSGFHYSTLGRRIQHHNMQPRVDGVMTLLPLLTAEKAIRPEVTDHLLRQIDPFKDVDGLNPDSNTIPATVEAATVLMRHVAPEHASMRTVIRGHGHVGRALAENLRILGQHVDVIDIDTPSEEATERLVGAEILFSATGVAFGLTTDHFARRAFPNVMINIGRGRAPTGKMVGDFSPDLITAAIARGSKVSSNAAGVGRLATLTSMSRTASYAEDRAKGLERRAS